MYAVPRSRLITVIFGARLVVGQSAVCSTIVADSTWWDQQLMSGLKNGSARLLRPSVGIFEPTTAWAAWSARSDP